MPVKLRVDATRSLALDEFVAIVESQPDLHEPESLAELAPAFRAFGNDPSLIADHFNRSIDKFFNGDRMMAYTPQSVMLGGGRGFFLRANIWTPLKLQEGFRSQEERVFSYRSTHDHNFSFMTLGYFGSGYETDLYRYDPDRVVGRVGEVVDLEFIERARLAQGDIMIFEEKRDAHTQFPPESLSISINLMVSAPRSMELDQYFFDPATRTITAMPDTAAIHRRASIVSLAGLLGNQDAAQVIQDLVRDAPCRRVRESAISAAMSLGGLDVNERVRIIGHALDDRDALVREHAHRSIESLAVT